MKTKNILMSVLLAMGFIAAKAAGYPPELALVSQPVLVYNYNSITVYYDVQNIGDYTYRGDICLFLSPDNGYCYAEKYIKVRPGRIKRVSIEIPAYRPNPARAYTIMPYYEVGDELYSFTTFEYFEPLAFYWNGPRTERWVVINMPPRVRYYTRPGIYRYYYDGFRPPMPPPHIAGHGPSTPPPPMNPMHHTYNYHHSNGGYPASNHWNDNPSTTNEGINNIQATVRPNNSAGSMSSSTTINGDNNTPTPSNVTTGSMSRPNSSNRPNGASTGSATHHNNNSSGNVNRPSSNSNNNSGNVSRPNSSNRPNGASTGSATHHNNSSGNVNRPSSNSNNNSGNVNRPSSNGRNNSGNVNRPSGNNNNNSGNVNRPSGNNNRNGSSSRPSNSNSSNTRTNSSNSGRNSGSSNSGRSR